MGVDCTTVTPGVDTSETGEEEKAIKVAKRQWAAHCRVWITWTSPSAAASKLLSSMCQSGEPFKGELFNTSGRVR